MVKTILKIGNSQGIILDAAIMDLVHLKVGDRVNVTVASGSGTIILEPIRNGPTKTELTSLLKRAAKDYRKTLRKLA